ncbi:slipin family protein [bacterium]|nr:slipin family protein [bacterium]
MFDLFSSFGVVILGFLVFSTIKIVPEYERIVVLRLGRFAGIRGPGLIFLIPGVERAIRVDLRTVTMDIPSQDIISKDNVTLKVNGVVYFRVEDPKSAIINVENHIMATNQIAQTTLRSVIGEFELDEILSQREDINKKLQEILDEQTQPWGIKVSIVEVKAIDLPEEMQRAMAKQAQAERDKRAKIISAQGEFEASKKLAEAAEVLATQKDAITLRYLDTMRDLGSNNNTSTIFFPLPISIFDKLNK